VGQVFGIKVDGKVLRGSWARPRGVDARQPTLVFLHDGLGSIALWRDFPAALGERLGLPAFVYERLGHGASDPATEALSPQSLDHEALDVLPKVLAISGIERAILVGHGDGGALALMFAAARPEMTRCLMTIGAHVFVEDAMVKGVQSAVAAYQSGLRQRLARYHDDNTDVLFDNWSTLWSSRSFRPWSIEKRLPDVASPLLALQGDRDEYRTKAQLERIAAGVGGPVEAFLVPNCGHAPHIQDRDRTLAAIARFVRRYG
jgi:pimeloyl-ACP methyl ester carboxylesterase